ncbi:MAG: hypothetical protein ACP5F3_01135 [Candidatus Syntrophosphaera sp.]
MKKKTIIGVIVGVIAILAGVFLGVDLTGGSEDPGKVSEFVGLGNEGEAFTTNNLMGVTEAGQNYTVYITKYGKKYHTEDCHYVLGKRISISRLEAIDEGYEPCKRCKPDENPPTADLNNLIGQ